MGGFYGSIHVKSADRQPVLDALKEDARRSKSRFLVAPQADGWITVYPDNGGQDERVSRRIARRLDCDLIHLISHHEEVFHYFVYRGRTLVDRYSSHPDRFHPVSPTLRRKLRGNPDSFRDLFRDGEDLDDVLRMLGDAEGIQNSSDLMVRFAERLIISGEVMTSYEYLREGAPDEVEDWDRFVHVPDLSRMEARRQREAAEVEERLGRLVRDGVLLVERVSQHRGPLGNPIACPDRDGSGFLICMDAGFGGHLGIRAPVERGGPPWSAGPSETDLTLDANVWALLPSPSGRYLLTSQGSRDDFRVDIRDMEADRLVETIRQPRGHHWYGFLPDETGWVGISRGQVDVVPIGGGREPATWDIKDGEHAAIHPSGTTLVIAGRKNRLLFVDLATGRLVKSLLMGGISQRSGIGVLARFVPRIGEAIDRVDRELGLASIQQQATRLQAERALRIPEEVVLSGKMPEPSPDEGSVRAREAIRAALLDVLRPDPAQGSTPGMFHFVPRVSTLEELEALFEGAVPAFKLTFDAEGRWLFCATDSGVLAFSWREILAAVSVTPTPLFSLDVEPYRDDFDDRDVTTFGHVYDLAYDAPANRLLFATMGGQVGYLHLPDGRSGILLEPPGRPPIMSLHLSRDRSAICITCSPNRFGRRREKKRSFVQIWNYAALENGLDGPDVI